MSRHLPSRGRPDDRSVPEPASAAVGRPDPTRRGLLLGAVLGGCGLAGATAAGVSARASSAAADDPTAFARNFDAMRLVDEQGRRFTFGAMQGRVLLVNWVTTGCSSVCPIQTRALVEVQRALPARERDGIRFVSVALDPLQDTPAALRAYAGTMGCDLATWRFVTGEPGDIEKLDARLRVFRPGGRRPDDHATALWLVDARGHLIQRLPGNPPDTARVLRELLALRST